MSDNPYSELLSSPSHGLAISHPSPPDDVPPSIRQLGVVLADLCVVHKDGSLDRLFNASRPAGDFLNSAGVPRSFVPLIVDNDIRQHLLCHAPESIITNATVRKEKIVARIEGGGSGTDVAVTAGFQVCTNAKRAALLYLPEGASSYDLRRERVVRQYVRKHSRQFLKFAQECGNEIGDEGSGLVFVTGVTKAPTWCIAVTNHSTGGGTVSLNLNAQLGGGRAAYLWESENASSSMSSGPHRGPGEESWGENQTVFVRGFRIVPSRFGAPSVLPLGRK